MQIFRQLKRYLIYKYKSKTNIDNLSDNFSNLSIDEIFKYFGTDKATKWKHGKNTGHGYSDYYEKHLKNYKDKKINILEIGSYAGASAASFIKYFPFSNVYCLDINLTNFKFISKNIKVFGLDVSKKRMVENFYKKINISFNTPFFDVIIDDGSHKLSDTLISINTFYRNLKPSGFYIIEDFKFPNYYKHLNDCSEIKIDELLNFLKSKNFFKSNIISEDMIEFLIDSTADVFQYRGLLSDSDIAFIKKLD